MGSQVRTLQRAPSLYLSASPADWWSEVITKQGHSHNTATEVQGCSPTFGVMRRSRICTRVARRPTRISDFHRTKTRKFQPQIVHRCSPTSLMSAGPELGRFSAMSAPRPDNKTRWWANLEEALFGRPLADVDSFPSLVLRIPDLDINKRRLLGLPFVNLLQATIDGNLEMIWRCICSDHFSILASADKLD